MGMQELTIDLNRIDHKLAVFPNGEVDYTGAITLLPSKNLVYPHHWYSRTEVTVLVPDEDLDALEDELKNCILPDPSWERRDQLKQLNSWDTNTAHGVTYAIMFHPDVSPQHKA